MGKTRRLDKRKRRQFRALLTRKLPKANAPISNDARCIMWRGPVRVPSLRDARPRPKPCPDKKTKTKKHEGLTCQHWEKQPRRRAWSPLLSTPDPLLDITPTVPVRPVFGRHTLSPKRIAYEMLFRVPFRAGQGISLRHTPTCGNELCVHPFHNFKFACHPRCPSATLSTRTQSKPPSQVAHHDRRDQ